MEYQTKNDKNNVVLKMLKTGNLGQPGPLDASPRRSIAKEEEKKKRGFKRQGGS